MLSPFHSGQRVYSDPGAVFIELLGWISCLGEGFKCIFLIYFQLYMEETLHAYEKTMFFISMKSFIEVVWEKLEKSGFEIFT